MPYRCVGRKKVIFLLCGVKFLGKKKWDKVFKEFDSIEFLTSEL